MVALRLLGVRRFGPFFWVQFLGALNDNVFRNALLILFAFDAVAGGRVSATTLVNASAGLFMLPYFLFSATAGQLADKFDKSAIIRLVKLAEIGLMVLGVVGLRLGSRGLLLAVLFLMGVHSAVFAPVKYSILPQHLSEDELVAGNALVQTGTFAAILAGTILGGVLVSIERWGRAVVSAALLLIALGGWLVSRAVPRAEAPDPALRLRWNPLRETVGTIRFACQDRTIRSAIVGISWFWFYGTVLLAQFPGLTREVLGGNERVATLLLTLFSVGVALGCLLCDRLSAGRIELGLVPLGAFGLSLFGLDLFLATRASSPPPQPIGPLAFLAVAPHWRVVGDLVLVAASGGCYIVPLQALLQHRSAARHRSRIIAGNNVVNALFMVLAAVLAIGLRHAGLTIPELLLVTAVLNAAVTGYIFMRVPEFLTRCRRWVGDQAGAEPPASP